MLITRERILSLKPCYELKDIEKLIPEQGIITETDDSCLERLLKLSRGDARWLLSNLLSPESCLEWAEASIRRAQVYVDVTIRKANDDDYLSELITAARAVGIAWSKLQQKENKEEITWGRWWCKKAITTSCLIAINNNQSVEEHTKAMQHGIDLLNREI